MSVISLSNIVQVSVVGTPSGITARNVNVVGLFTTETPNNLDTFRIYLSASEVANDYGTNSVAFQMASNIYAQDLNLGTGKGHLVILPLDDSVSATSELSETPDISLNIPGILQVSDGDLKIEIDGKAFELANINFSNALDLDGIIQVIKNKLYLQSPNANLEAIEVDSSFTLDESDGTNENMSTATYFNSDGADTNTNKKITTTDLSGSVLADIKLVGSGDLKVILNGIDFDLIGMDFSSTVTLSDVADVLLDKLGTVAPDVDITVTNVGDFIVFEYISIGSNAIKFSSKKVGASDSKMSYEQASVISGTDLSTVSFLNSDSRTTTVPTDASGETLVSAIQRTTDKVFYAAVITNLNMEDAVITTTANAIQAQSRMFLHHFASTEDIFGIGDSTSGASQDKTRILLHTESLDIANLYKSASVGRSYVVNFSSTNTNQTMNLKVLNNVIADQNINQTLYNAALDRGVDLYVPYNGVSAVFSTRGNKFFDKPYNDQQLEFDLEAALFNHLRQTNFKIPQTEEGMSGLKNAAATVFKKHVNNGALAPGKWTTTDTFGDKTIFLSNIETEGFYVFSIPINQQDPIERQNREAVLIQCAAKRAGAIHTVDVLVSIND